MVNIKVDKPNNRSMACLLDTRQTNPTGQWPGSNSLIRELLQLIYKEASIDENENTAIKRLP